MSTVFLLVRHAAHDGVGVTLTGRMPGVGLGTEGRAQAERLAQSLRHEPLAAIHASPQQRTQETAMALAAAQGMARIASEPALDEIDFGSAWQGKSFAALEADPAWQRWNSQRSLARTPGGERMLDVQARVLALIERLLPRHEEESVALVTHADVIKALVSHVLGLGIDAWPRLEVAPASVSRLVVGEWGAKLTGLNQTTP